MLLIHEFAMSDQEKKEETGFSSPCTCFFEEGSHAHPDAAVDFVAKIVRIYTMNIDGTSITRSEREINHRTSERARRQ